MNDEQVEIADQSTLSDLCGLFGLDPSRVVMCVDGHIIPRREYDGWILRQAAAVEVMMLAGGG